MSDVPYTDPRCGCTDREGIHAVTCDYWPQYVRPVNEHSADIDARQGRPLGPASGGDQGFWDRLGVDEGGLPVHLPMGVNERGQGPEDDSAAYTFVCWCGDAECPLTLALGHAWASGRRVTPPGEEQ